MKIAVDVRSLMEGGVSGVERYTAEIVRGLVRVAPENEYHLFFNSARKVTLPDFGNSVVVHEFRYPNKVFKLAQRTLQIPKWDRWLPGMDCFFMPSLGLMPISSGVPLVSVFHDLSFEHFPELFNFEKRLWHWVMQPKKLAQRSDAIVAVSEHTKRDVVNLYNVPEEKVRVVYSGVELDNFRTGPAALAPPHGGRQQLSVRRAGDPRRVTRFLLPEHFILYLGTLEPRKNVDTLVQAYSAIADSVEQDLVIAGALGWSTRELENVITGSAHTKRIHRLGFVPEEEKAALYAAADLFVYPSLYEGFGFPPLEALLAGTPVVTSFNSALPEVVGKWATLIDPYDTAGLALVLKELLQDIPLVPDEVRVEIQQNYSWENAARETLGVLAEVA